MNQTDRDQAMFDPRTESGASCSEGERHRPAACDRSVTDPDGEKGWSHSKKEGIAMRTILLSMLLLAAPLRAQEPMGQTEPINMGKMERFEEAARAIGLEPQQRDQVRRILMDQRRSSIDLRADLEKKRLDIEDLMQADNPDEARASTVLDQMMAARGRLEKSQMMTLLHMRKVLTKEQWDKLREFRSERHEGGFGRQPMSPHGPSGGSSFAPRPPRPPGWRPRTRHRRACPRG